MADKEEQKQAEEGQEGGTLLVCGATDWYSIGRTKEVRPEYPNLSVPHRLKALEVNSRRPPSSQRPAAAVAPLFERLSDGLARHQRG